MKTIFILAFLFSFSSFANGIRCNSNIRSIPIDFVKLNQVSKNWYTPYSTHFINQSNFCSTSFYKLENPYPYKGLELNGSIKKRNVKNHFNEDFNSNSKGWEILENYFVDVKSKPGFSQWTTKVGPFTINTDQYVFAASPNSDWWAIYYCAKSKNNLKVPFTEGIDIRSAHWPMDPSILPRIKAAAISAGVDPKLVSKIKASQYVGCSVKDRKGNKLTVSKNAELR